VGLTFGLRCRDDAYATAILCVVNAHQSLAVEANVGLNEPRARASVVLRTGAFVPVHALREEQHAYSRLILSSLMPLA